MKKRLTLLLLGICFLFCLVGCGSKAEKNKTAETDSKENVLASKNIEKIQAQMGKYLSTGMHFGLAGAYSILCDIDTETDVADFISKFDGWTREGNEVNFEWGGFLDKTVFFKISDDFCIACTTDIVDLGNGKSGYAGCINTFQYIMPEAFGEYTKELFEFYIEKAHVVGIDDLVVVDELFNTRIDFSKFDDEFTKKDCMRENYGRVMLGEGYKSGMSLDELQYIMTNSADTTTMGNVNSAAVYFIDEAYSFPSPRLEYFDSSRLWCYFSGEKLIAVTYYKFNFNIDGYDSIADYENFALERFEKENPDDEDVKAGVIDIYERYDDIYYDRPSFEDIDMSIDFYYYNLETLESDVYSDIACNYNEEDVSYFYLTNDEINYENCENYRPSEAVEYCLMGAGKFNDWSIN